MTDPSKRLPGWTAGFTPGPWMVNPFNAQIDCEKLSRKGGLLPVAQMLWPTDERSEAETEANARLIAAAPDLYEALVAAISAWKAGGDGDNVFAEHGAAMNAALAKALGK